MNILPFPAPPGMERTQFVKPRTWNEVAKLYPVRRDASRRDPQDWRKVRSMSARNRLYRERLRPGVNVSKSTTWAATGPRLREVLKRTGEIIVCPELGTRWPAAVYANFRTGGMSAFAVAIRCKADMAFCTAYVPKVDMALGPPWKLELCNFEIW
jgi:hypothetical protein